MGRHATRKLHVPLGGSLLSMLIGSCCCSGCCDRGVDNGGSRLCNIGGGTDCGGIEGFNGGGGSDGGGGHPQRVQLTFWKQGCVALPRRCHCQDSARVRNKPLACRHGASFVQIMWCTSWNDSFRCARRHGRNRVCFGLHSLVPEPRQCHPSCLEGSVGIRLRP